MGTRQNPYPLRIDKILLEKLKVVAHQNGRSANKEIEMLIKKHIQSYETEFHKIEIPNLFDDE